MSVRTRFFLSDQCLRHVEGENKIISGMISRRPISMPADSASLERTE